MSSEGKKVDVSIRSAFSKTEDNLKKIGIATYYKYDRDGHYLVISLKSLVSAVRSKADPRAWDFMTIDIVDNELILFCPRGDLIVSRTTSSEADTKNK